MTTLYENAYAKINLTLDVLGKRADGYHDLQSVMQAISLHDEVEIDVGTGKPWALRCDKEDVPCDQRNLGWKAAEVFEKALQKDLGGIEIRITKRIPSQAGLGGGSSDAAAVLLALNRYCGNPFSVLELADLSAQVGSDVPFCVLGGTAMAEGRGERLRKLPDMPQCTLVICKPEFGVSTPALYKKLDETVIARRPDNAAMERALVKGNLEDIAGNVHNVFDPVVALEHSEIGHIKSIMHSCGALNQQMTGSGSAVFAIMPDREHAKMAFDALKKSYPSTFVAQTMGADAP